MNTKTAPSASVRIVALVLLLGGLAGIVTSLRLVAYFAGQHQWLKVIVPACPVPLFAWTVWVTRTNQEPRWMMGFNPVALIILLFLARRGRRQQEGTMMSTEFLRP